MPTEAPDADDTPQIDSTGVLWTPDGVSRGDGVEPLDYPAGNYRLKVSVDVDDSTARNEMLINPCFHDDSALTPNGAASMAQTFADALGAYIGTGCVIKSRAYQLPITKPSYPVAVYTRGTAGSYLTSQEPREVALCLSYYAASNQPRYRGRLYIPYTWIRLHGGSGSLGQRPTSAQRGYVADLMTTVFTSMKTAKFPWILYSKAAGAARLVTNWYVDDEWDTIRSRGTAPTARTSGSYTYP